jgi:IS1 family transposase
MAMRERPFYREQCRTSKSGRDIDLNGIWKRRGQGQATNVKWHGATNLDMTLRDSYRKSTAVHQVCRKTEIIRLKGGACAFYGLPINNIYPLVKLGLHQIGLSIHNARLPFHEFGLVSDLTKSQNRRYYAAESDKNQGDGRPSAKLCEVERPSLHLASALFFGVGLGSLCIALVMAFCVNYNRPFLAAALIGPFIGIAAASPIWWFNYCFLYPYTWGLPPNWLPKKWNPCEQEKRSPHGLNVSQKVLTSFHFPYYTKYMANVLSAEKQAGIIGALCEGSSIRSIERMTGVHRDTIMRLGVRVGQGCMELMDQTMRGLSCTRLEMDEIWGFVGKKQKNVGLEDDPSMGDVWTFCAIDADTKLVPSFMVGKRDKETAKAFVEDLSGRMNNRLQISTDGLAAYVDAISEAFGNDVDFAQIIKTYGHQEVSNNRRYSAPDFVSSEKIVVIGNPDNDLISTSYVERLNATTRLHMRRLTRLTLAFSKKLDNFEAAVGLHFAYYNFVKKHSTVKCTPAMAAGVATDYWSVADLVRTAA